MDNLVFLRTQDLHEEPFTTSEIISKSIGYDHFRITCTIDKFIEDFQEMGETQKIVVYNQDTARQSSVYQLNEQQATLLMTYLGNKKEVREFKKELVRQFYRMRSELNKRAITREIVKEGRRKLTDVIKEKIPDTKWTYKHLTDLDYKCVLGMNAKQFETRYNIPNGKIRDYIHADQLQQVGILEAAEKALVEAGYTYHEIKDILSRKFLDRKTG